MTPRSRSEGTKSPARSSRRTRKPKDLALIIHGERAGLATVRHLVEWVREKGHHVRPRVTFEAGDGVELAREAAQLGVDAVIAVGGDGTVNEVLNGLSGSDVPMGIIPLGTANDFSRQAGIPDDADHAMDVILQRKAVHIDSAELNGRRFLNVSTAGVGAEATAETPVEAKRALGPLAYAITGVRKLADLTPRRAKFTAKGFSFDGEFLVFAVGNARVTGGGTVITPEASLTDGLLDLCIIEHMPRHEFARMVLHMKRGEHVEEEGVHYVQVPAVEIVAATPITVNVDGESAEMTTLSYRSRGQDLWIYLPRVPGAAR